MTPRFSDAETHYHPITSDTPYAVDGYALGEHIEWECAHCGARAAHIDGVEAVHAPWCPQRVETDDRRRGALDARGVGGVMSVSRRYRRGVQFSLDVASHESLDNLTPIRVRGEFSSGLLFDHRLVELLQQIVRDADAGVSHISRLAMRADKTDPKCSACGSFFAKQVDSYDSRIA